MRVGVAGILLGAFGAALLGCGEGPTAPAAAVALHLDRASYVATPVDPGSGYVQYAFRAVVRYENTTNDTIYFEMCRPDSPTPIFSVAVLDGGESGYDPGWACVGMPPLAFPPGATRTDTLLIRGPNAFDHYTHQPIGPVRVTGIYRLEYSTVQGSNGNMPGPRVASAPFWVRLF